MEKIKSWIREHHNFVIYFTISCFITVLDVFVSFVVEKGISVGFPAFTGAALIGNAAGVITGFIVQYILCTRKIYAGSNLRTMMIFFLTWLLNIGIAEGIIYVVRSLIFHNADGMIYFLVGKGVSIIIPFFITYFLRKKLIPEKTN